MHEVITNPATIENDTEHGQFLAIHPLGNNNSHSCPNGCPENLCKGTVVDQYLSSQNFDQVVFVGDGYNDYCPGLRLRTSTSDHLFAREGYGLHKMLQQQTIPGSFSLWKEHSDLLNLFDNFVFL